MLRRIKANKQARKHTETEREGAKPHVLFFYDHFSLKENIFKCLKISLFMHILDLLSLSYM